MRRADEGGMIVMSHVVDSYFISLLFYLTPLKASQGYQVFHHF